MYPESLTNLIESFRYLPGIGEKTAERLAFAVLNLSTEKAELFSASIGEVKSKIHQCPNCNNMTEKPICDLCTNELRNHETLCVVEDPKSVFLFEKLGTFDGVYHVINGLISPIDGINPEDIGLDKLISRIKTGKFKEIILAFRSSIEGETTALYIKKVLDGLNLTISKIASGIPMGADIEYIDALTLERAFNDRKNIE